MIIRLLIGFGVLIAIALMTLVIIRWAISLRNDLVAIFAVTPEWSEMGRRG